MHRALPGKPLYTRVLCTYALSLGGTFGGVWGEAFRPAAVGAMDALLEDCADAACTHWSSAAGAAGTACDDYYRCTAAAADVEMSGYVLLAMLRINDVPALHPVADAGLIARAAGVAKWLLSQRSSIGRVS